MWPFKKKHATPDAKLEAVLKTRCATPLLHMNRNNGHRELDSNQPTDRSPIEHT
jgi:hypothetical protein